MLPIVCSPETQLLCSAVFLILKDHLLRLLDGKTGRGHSHTTDTDRTPIFPVPDLHYMQNKISHLLFSAVRKTALGEISYFKYFLLKKTPNLPRLLDCTQNSLYVFCTALQNYQMLTRGTALNMYPTQFFVELCSLVE